MRGHFVRYRKGQELMGQGDDGDNLLIILTGFARVSMVASNGHEIVLDYAEPG
ncbi:cyclic nucleotide-binding domain-containing protein [Acinetobacter baumannii]